MKIRFWGARGSLPTPLSNKNYEQKIRAILEKASNADLSTPLLRENFIQELPFTERFLVGGNTACIEIRADNKILILDMGSGLVELGNYINRYEQNDLPLDFHLFISHSHWDHIVGFPFFKPAFLPQNTLTFYTPFSDFKERLEYQQDFRFFPISLNHIAAKKNFITLKPNAEYQLDDIVIQNIKQYHPGGSYGYKISYGGKSLVYATDSEYKNLRNNFLDKHRAFFEGTDLLIFDAQYTMEEALHKEDWGHSTAMQGVDFAISSGVKKLALFHHDPDNDDYRIYSILRRAIEYKRTNYPTSPLEILIAREDLILTL
ncbi:MAG: MBL fold metallo-hydrolase [Candidatus Marinimicrobia bacterium]|nr:MBL fold metallo-hydrolase [Candidatus Neomarinimicrobiota bacterium]MDD5582339.1 MBL fold metallo-hydrolase [Candidatus Neomarinimicrobiota bacterium]